MCTRIDASCLLESHQFWVQRCDSRDGVVKFVSITSETTFLETITLTQNCTIRKGQFLKEYNWFSTVSSILAHYTNDRQSRGKSNAHNPTPIRLHILEKYKCNSSWNTICWVKCEYETFFLYSQCLQDFTIDQEFLSFDTFLNDRILL